MSKKKFFKIDKLSIKDIIAMVILLGLIAVYLLSPKVILITTGKYGQGKESDKLLVDKAFGEAYAKDRYNLYFQWYNVVHEIGHGIIAFNNGPNLNKADEEQLVNDFAVAYWNYYGENIKLEELKNAVNSALSNINDPSNGKYSHIEYAKKMWDDEDFYSFNTYGWFQFSCVNKSLNNSKSLEDVLKEMGVKKITVQSQQTLVYDDINEDVSTTIISDAVFILRKWGAVIPDVYHNFSADPNNNMVSLDEKNILGIYDLLYEKASK